MHSHFGFRVIVSSVAASRKDAKKTAKELGKRGVSISFVDLPDHSRPHGGEITLYQKGCRDWL
jgi:hypothetical protein